MTKLPAKKTQTALIPKLLIEFILCAPILIYPHWTLDTETAWKPPTHVPLSTFVFILKRIRCSCPIRKFHMGSHLISEGQDIFFTPSILIHYTQHSFIQIPSHTCAIYTLLNKDTNEAAKWLAATMLQCYFMANFNT